MPHRITQPTKEQVRAYMMARESARLPPPSPEEIRRQLNWRLTPPDEDRAFLELWLLPSRYGHLASRLALHLFFSVLLISASRDQP